MVTAWRSRLLPPVVASVALLAQVSVLYRTALRETSGVVSYPIDDAFIHLALAKQIAVNGVYGVTPHEFAAASSSVGWPVFLAVIMKVAGVSVWLPLLVNGAFALALFLAVDHAMRRLAPDASTLARVLVALVVMGLTPLATLVVLGMEHTAHAFATVAFVTTATTWLSNEDAASTSPRSALAVAVWAAATTLWRYEGLFVVGLVVVLSLARRRKRAAFMVAGGGALPIVMFGLYSVSHGAHFFPVPVLLKGRHFDLQNAHAYYDLLGGPALDHFGTEGYALALAAALAGLAVFVVRRESFWSPRALALLVTLGAIMLHLEFASVGWFFRYEAYLLVTSLVFLGATLAHVLPAPRDLWRSFQTQPATAIAGLGIIILSAPLGRRAFDATRNTPSACRNVYQQQMQSARFLATYFPRERVAVNDIGAVAWAGNDRLVDLLGLATLSVAEAKHLRLDTPMSRHDIVGLTRGVKVAIVYDEWFKDNLPTMWLRVGRWRIRDNRSCAFPTVAIYATDPESYPAVIHALRSFAPTLPPGVMSEGRFADWPLVADDLRAGDRVFVGTTTPELSGSYFVDADGTIPLRGFGPTYARGLTATELQHRLEDPRRRHRGGTVQTVARVVPRAPSIHVAGEVSTSGELPTVPLTIDAAIASAGALPSADSSAAWVWREQADGFTKVARAALVDGALVDGDIVVVPPIGAEAP